MNDNYVNAEIKDVDLTDFGEGYILIVKFKGGVALHDTFTFEIINVRKNYYHGDPKINLVYKECMQDIHLKASKIIDKHKKL